MNQHDDGLDLDPEGTPSLAEWLEHIRAAEAVPPSGRPGRLLTPAEFAALDGADQHAYLLARLREGRTAAAVAHELSLRAWVVQNVAAQAADCGRMT